jgi:hypothetical protein
MYTHLKLKTYNQKSKTINNLIGTRVYIVIDIHVFWGILKINENTLDVFMRNIQYIRPWTNQLNLLKTKI